MIRVDVVGLPRGRILERLCDERGGRDERSANGGDERIPADLHEASPERTRRHSALEGVIMPSKGPGRIVDPVIFDWRIIDDRRSPIDE